MIKSLELAGVAFFIGAAFVVASWAIGMVTFDVCWLTQGSGEQVTTQIVSCAGSYTVRKQVGFAAALNWSLGLTFLFPFFIYCACETANHGLNAIEQFAKRQMIVTEKLALVSAKDVFPVLRRRAFLLLAAEVLVVIIATAFLAKEFTNVVLQFYGDPAAIASISLGGSPELEADWSIAGPICRALTDTSPACRELNANFDWNGHFAMAAYGYLAWIGAIVAIGFMIAVGLFATVFVSADFKKARFLLLPDVDSTDKRRGFEVLEGFFLHAIAACFTLFAMGYLVVLQNVYLRTDYGTIGALIVPFLVAVEEPSAGGVIAAMAKAVSEQFGVINGNVVAVVVLGLLFLLIMIISAALALGSAARRGRARLLQVLADGSEEDRRRAKVLLGDRTVAQARKSLDDFEAWPLNWPSVKALFAWLVLALISLLFVTVGFYLMSVGIAYVVAQAFALAKKSPTP